MTINQTRALVVTSILALLGGLYYAYVFRPERQLDERVHWWYGQLRVYKGRGIDEFQKTFRGDFMLGEFRRETADGDQDFSDIPYSKSAKNVAGSYAAIDGKTIQLFIMTGTPVVHVTVDSNGVIKSYKVTVRAGNAP